MCEYCKRLTHKRLCLTTAVFSVDCVVSVGTRSIRHVCEKKLISQFSLAHIGTHSGVFVFISILTALISHFASPRHIFSACHTSVVFTSFRWEFKFRSAVTIDSFIFIESFDRLWKVPSSIYLSSEVRKYRSISE